MLTGRECQSVTHAAQANGVLVSEASMARQIIYVFNDDPSNQEIETDSDDSIKIPASGTRYSHNGKSWFVARVENCQMLGVPVSIRTVRIFLVDIN
jgi:hypothetical protein